MDTGKNLKIERIDWFRLIADLNLRGYDCTHIASVVGVTKNTVRYWRDTGEPRYEDGKRLIALWSQVISKSQEFAPRISR
jgi:uncharacterized protein YjcR